MELLISIGLLVLITLIYSALVTRLVRSGRVADSRLPLITLGIYILSFIFLVFMPLQINLDEYRVVNTINSINYYPVITIDAKSFLLNVMLFAPLGVFMYLLGFRTLRKVILVTMLISLSVEILQFIGGISIGSLRSVDVNDLIANTLGGVVGFIAVRYISRHESFSKYVHKFILRLPSQ